VEELEDLAPLVELERCGGCGGVLESRYPARLPMISVLRELFRIDHRDCGSGQRAPGRAPRRPARAAA
jgi:hypothetical protein